MPPGSFELFEAGSSKNGKKKTKQIFQCVHILSLGALQCFYFYIIWYPLQRESDYETAKLQYNHAQI